MSLKTRIRELRARDRLSQEDLARKVGVRRETIGNLENGRYNPSLKLAMDIAKVFDTTVEEFLRSALILEREGECLLPQPGRQNAHDLPICLFSYHLFHSFPPTFALSYEDRPWDMTSKIFSSLILGTLKLHTSGKLNFSP